MRPLLSALRTDRRRCGGGGGEDFADRRIVERWAAQLRDTEVYGSQHSSVQLVAGHKRWVQRLMQVQRWNRKAAALPLLAIHLEPAELVWTCDAVLDDGTEYAGVLHFLIDRPHLPMSRAVARLLATLPLHRHSLLPLQLASEYLLARRVEHTLVREKLVAFGRLAEVESQTPFEVYSIDQYVTSFVDYMRLALKVAPDHALDLIRRALRRDSEHVVEEVAASMLVANQPWCARELESAYRDRPPHAEVLRQALGMLPEPPDGIPHPYRPEQVRHAGHVVPEGRADLEPRGAEG